MDLRITRKINAYTLTEILVVLVIIGILILLALPNLMPLITKAKTTEAKLQLEHLANLQRSHFYEYSTYGSDLIAIGFIQEKLSGDDGGGKANYKIEIVSASKSAFIAKAVAVADFDGDGVFNVWQIDQNKVLKEIIPD